MATYVGVVERLREEADKLAKLDPAEGHEITAKQVHIKIRKNYMSKMYDERWSFTNPDVNNM